MGRIKLGICLKSLGLPFRRSLPQAQTLGALGIELEAAGELRPQNLTQTGRREIKHLLRSHDLAVSALTCPLRRGLDEAQDLEPRLEQIRLTMSLAFDIGPRMVVIQPGRIATIAKDAEGSSNAECRVQNAEKKMPTESKLLVSGNLQSAICNLQSDPGPRLMRESLLALGKHGDRVGVSVALDVGNEDPTAVAAVLDGLDVGSLAINFNPAHLILAGFNPHDAVRTLARRIAHVHAEDARRISPSKIATVSVGHGDIDWLQLAADFEAVEYRGCVTVLGKDRGELASGVSFLRRFLA